MEHAWDNRDKSQHRHRHQSYDSGCTPLLQERDPSTVFIDSLLNVYLDCTDITSSRHSHSDYGSDAPLLAAWRLSCNDNSIEQGGDDPVTLIIPSSTLFGQNMFNTPNTSLEKESIMPSALDFNPALGTSTEDLIDMIYPSEDELVQENTDVRESNAGLLAGEDAVEAIIDAYIDEKLDNSLASEVVFSSTLSKRMVSKNDRRKEKEIAAAVFKVRPDWTNRTKISDFLRKTRKLADQGET